MQALKQVGLEARSKHYPGQMSGGEQQRVALARAFAPQPSIILADEPTGNLDQNTGLKVMDLLFDLQRQNNITLVMVTHDQGLARRCQRTVTMMAGHLEE